MIHPRNITPRETSQETIARILFRDAAERAGNEDRIIRVEHTVGNVEGPVGSRKHDVAFWHADGRMEYFPGHRWGG